MYRKELLGETKDWIIEYISSIDHDKEIIKHVIITLIEHVLELYRCGILNREVFCKIYRKLREILETKIDELYISNLYKKKYEDIHELIEKYLIETIGPEYGGWIGIGRSRNDHVVTAHRLRLREYTCELLEKLLEFRKVLVEKSAQFKDIKFIAFTHGQPAQVTLLSHYLLSVDELIENFINVLLYVTENLIERSPLGSGPAVGVLTPIDRLREAEDLNMKIIYNTLYATESRDYFTVSTSIITSLAVELSRFVNDLIRLSDPSYDLIRIPDEHCATSSIMPHKRNPATLEVARARISKIIGSLVTILCIVKEVGKGYYLDLQEVTPEVWNIFRNMIELVDILKDVVSRIIVNIESINNLINKTYITSSETVELISIQEHRNFRDVYMELARNIKQGSATLINADDVLKLRKSLGSASFEQVELLINRALDSIKNQESKIGKLRGRIVETYENIFSKCEDICK